MATYTLHLPSNLPDNFLDQLCLLHRKQGYSSTPASVSINDPQFIAITADDGKLVATASVSYINETDAWLSNVFVEKENRRKGWGSKIVKEALTYIAEHGHAQVVSLLSTPDAISLYEKLGFARSSSSASSIYICKIEACRLIPTPDCEIVTTEGEHNSALQLFSRINGAAREFVVKNILSIGGSCAIATYEGEVVAAAWGRQTKHDEKAYRAFFIGPIVGRSTKFAHRVCSKLIQNELNKTTARDDGDKFWVHVNAMSKDSDNSAKELCEALGMTYYEPLIHMTRATDPTSEIVEEITDLVKCNYGYYGLMGWSMG